MDSSRDISKDSREDAMVAALLGLKAQQLSGQIEPQQFRVTSMHIIWCSQQAGYGEAVARRVDAELANIAAGCKE